MTNNVLYLKTAAGTPKGERPFYFKFGAIHVTANFQYAVSKYRSFPSLSVLRLQWIRHESNPSETWLETIYITTASLTAKSMLHWLE